MRDPENLLLEVGLSKKEAVIYSFLLKNGTKTVACISRAVNLSKPTVYEAIDLLKGKNLIYLHGGYATPKDFSLYADDFLWKLHKFTVVAQSLKMSYQLFASHFHDNYSRNQMMARKIFETSFNKPIHIVALNGSKLLQIAKEFDLKQAVIITDKECSLKVRKIFYRRKEQFYSKASLIFVDHALYLYLDGMKKSLIIEDKELVEFLSKNFLSKFPDEGN